ncbi:hypothetical protein O181_043184 [Austropuccinia psidii MF-1]|uniref:Uncharacterized protein n=1 Tax=Austropuccinia psidii MF-1 TaxID=1389203 RepID=A0A9Q3HI67_9BASI|nr:hypothetical protein [Austropuccinia psidii MF-1]
MACNSNILIDSPIICVPFYLHYNWHTKPIHASTNQIPAVLEKVWNPTLTQDSLKNNLVELNPTSAGFTGILAKSMKHVVRCMEDSFAYAKDKWDKSNATPDFKVGVTTMCNDPNGCLCQINPEPLLWPNGLCQCLMAFRPYPFSLASHGLRPYPALICLLDQ